MMSKFVSALLFGGLCLGITADAAAAAPKRAQNQGENYTLHRRGGGYSYNYADTINTYGGSRSATVGARNSAIRRWSGRRKMVRSITASSSIPRLVSHGGSAPYMQ